MVHFAPFFVYKGSRKQEENMNFLPRGHVLKNRKQLRNKKFWYFSLIFAGIKYLTFFLENRKEINIFCIFVEDPPSDLLLKKIKKKNLYFLLKSTIFNAKLKSGTF